MLMRLKDEKKSNPKLKKTLKFGLSALVFTYLVYKISEIGWRSILKSLPTSPYFYLITLINFFILPFTEIIVYRLTIFFPFWSGFKAFALKKVFNTELISYSGEAYLYSHAKKYWNLDKKDLFGVIKNNTIISASSTYLTAIVLTVVLTYFSQIDFLKFIEIDEKDMYLFFALIVFGFTVLFSLHDKIISTSLSTTLKAFSLYQLKALVMYVLTVVQCSIVLPEVPLSVWFTFIVAQIIFKLIPFIPSQDLAVLGLYAKISEVYAVSQPEIMALFIAIVAFSKVISFASYTALSFLNTKSKVLLPKKNSQSIE